MLCALVVVVLLLLRFGEGTPLSAIGLVRPRLRSVALGLGIGAGVFVALALIALTLSRFGLFDNNEASETVLQWPLSFRVAVALAAGLVEETLYRGYAIERLSAIIGARWLAGGVALAAFALAHVPFWGWSAIATPIVGGAFFTILYLWRRDLVACIVAHATIDVIASLWCRPSLAPTDGVAQAQVRSGGSFRPERCRYRRTPRARRPPGNETRCRRRMRARPARS